jgi:uncharacterized protein (TIGR02246 family)
MHHKLAAGLVLAVTGLVSGCQRSQTIDARASDAGAAKDAVASVEEGMLNAFHAKDGKRLATYYASDAISVVPGEEMKGSDAIAKSNAAAFKDPGFKLDFSNERTDVATSGDLAYTSGVYTATYTNPETKAVVSDSGRYLTVFKKQPDNTWKAVADFATSTKH